MEPQINVVKLVNGDDANETGPTLAAGDPVTWTYRVTNPGTLALVVVRLLDDGGTPADPSDDVTLVLQGGDSDGDGLLDPGETWQYVLTGTAELGRYLNTATVEGIELQTYARTHPELRQSLQKFGANPNAA